MFSVIFKAFPEISIAIPVDFFSSCNIEIMMINMHTISSLNFNIKTATVNLKEVI